MSELASEPERSHNLDRFLTFIDAIVAIAVTLLVLPLVDLAGEVGRDESVNDLIKDNTATIGAFFLSFLVISRLWLIQHRTLRHAVKETRGRSSS